VHCSPRLASSIKVQLTVVILALFALVEKACISIAECPIKGQCSEPFNRFTTALWYPTFVALAQTACVIVSPSDRAAWEAIASDRDRPQKHPERAGVAPRRYGFSRDLCRGRSRSMHPKPFARRVPRLRRQHRPGYCDRRSARGIPMARELNRLPHVTLEDVQGKCGREMPQPARPHGDVVTSTEPLTKL
jgi:hypothetical protein